MPDATCNYVYAGELNGRAYLRRLDGLWFIWWDGIENWYISDVLGAPEEYWWIRDEPSIEGIYYPFGASLGNATVTAGEH